MGLSLLIHKTGKAQGDGQGLCYLGQSLEWDFGCSGRTRVLSIPLGIEVPLTEFSQKPLISNILSPVLLKCKGMMNLSNIETVPLRLPVIPGSHTKVFRLTHADPWGIPEEAGVLQDLCQQHPHSPIPQGVGITGTMQSEVLIRSHTNQGQQWGQRGWGDREAGSVRGLGKSF